MTLGCQCARTLCHRRRGIKSSKSQLPAHTTVRRLWNHCLIGVVTANHLPFSGRGQYANEAGSRPITELWVSISIVSADEPAVSQCYQITSATSRWSSRSCHKGRS